MAALWLLAATALHTMQMGHVMNKPTPKVSRATMKDTINITTPPVTVA
jgi:hypothetical protein